MQRKFQNARQGRGQVVTDTDKVEVVGGDDLSALNIRPVKFSLQVEICRRRMEEEDEEQHHSTPQTKAASLEATTRGAAAPVSQKTGPRVIGRMSGLSGRMSKSGATVAEGLLGEMYSSGMFKEPDTGERVDTELHKKAKQPRAPRAPRKQALTTPTSHPAPTHELASRSRASAAVARVTPEVVIIEGVAVSAHVSRAAARAYARQTEGDDATEPSAETNAATEVAVVAGPVLAGSSVGAAVKPRRKRRSVAAAVKPTARAADLARAAPYPHPCPPLTLTPTPTLGGCHYWAPGHGLPHLATDAGVSPRIYTLYP